MSALHRCFSTRRSSIHLLCRVLSDSVGARPSELPGIDWVLPSWSSYSSEERDKINKCIIFFSQQIDFSKWVKRKLEEGNSKAGSAFVDKVVQAFLWRQQLA